MRSRSINVLVDAFWGSSGKGKLAAALAEEFSVTHASSSNLPNAGHTTVIGDRRVVTKVLPAACVANPGVKAWITPNSAFWPDQLHKEWEACDRPSVTIHERAIVMRDSFVEAETTHPDLIGLASTKQGAGAAQVARIFRQPVTAKDVEVLRSNLISGISLFGPRKWFEEIKRILDKRSYTWLHEVSQGFALGLMHGSHYPQCTSRECSAAQAAVDLGISPSWIGDVWLNVRAFPIRVGNTADGYSGDFYHDCNETSLSDIMTDAGIPESQRAELSRIETTTVTKRARRFCTMSWTWLRFAAAQNGATHLALNFAQYLNWKDHKCQRLQNLSKETRQFMAKMEYETQVPVMWVGTGEDHQDCVWI